MSPEKPEEPPRDPPKNIPAASPRSRLLQGIAKSPARPPKPGSTVGQAIQHALELRKADSGIIDPLDQQDVDRLFALISTDPDMALAKSRVILERLITNVFKARVGPPGTRTLESLIRDAAKAGALPRKVAALCDVVRELGNVGAHPILDDEKVTHREAQLTTMTLLLIFEWYNRERAKPVSPVGAVPPRYRHLLEHIREWIDLSRYSGSEESLRRDVRIVVERTIDAEQPLLNRIEREKVVDQLLFELTAHLLPVAPKPAEGPS